MGHETCSPLVFHHKIEIIAFIGNGSTGVKIMTGATKLVKPITLKLGGKIPIVVFDDIHALEKSVEWTLVSCLWIKFQCRVTSGLILQKPTASQILDRLVEGAKNIKISYHLEDDCNPGFLISLEQYEKVLKYKILCLFVSTSSGEFILVKYHIEVLIDQVGKVIREFRSCCSKTYTLDVIFKMPCGGMLLRSVEIYYMYFLGLTAMTQKVVIEFAFTVVALVCLVFAAIVRGMNIQEDEGPLVENVNLQSNVLKNNISTFILLEVIYEMVVNDFLKDKLEGNESRKVVAATFQMLTQVGLYIYKAKSPKLKWKLEGGDSLKIFGALQFH